MKEKTESIGGFFTAAETSRIHDDVGAIVKKLRWADVSDDGCFVRVGVLQ